MEWKDGRLITDYCFDQLDHDHYVVRLVDENGKTIRAGEPFEIAPTVGTRDRRALFEDQAHKLRAVEEATF